jgi:hypothetical protein
MQRASKYFGCLQKLNSQMDWSKSSLIRFETRVGSVIPGCKQNYSIKIQKPQQLRKSNGHLAQNPDVPGCIVMENNLS